jgi:hypothetical protein
MWGFCGGCLAGGRCKDRGALERIACSSAPHRTTLPVRTDESTCLTSLTPAALFGCQSVDRPDGSTGKRSPQAVAARHTGWMYLHAPQGGTSSVSSIHPSIHPYQDIHGAMQGGREVRKTVRVPSPAQIDPNPRLLSISTPRPPNHRCGLFFPALCQ